MDGWVVVFVSTMEMGVVGGGCLLSVCSMLGMGMGKLAGRRRWMGLGSRQRK